MALTRVCIYGAGAVGTYLGAVTAQAYPANEVEVSLVCRGDHLHALKNSGIIIEAAGYSPSSPITNFLATDDPAILQPQDIIIVTLKAYSIPEEAEKIAKLRAKNGTVVLAQNGIPFNFFYKWQPATSAAADLGNSKLTTVDPNGHAWDCLGPETCVPCVLYIATEITKPGTVKSNSKPWMQIGELDLSRPSASSSRCLQIQSLLAKAGVDVRIESDIRSAIWTKLWGNTAFNPLTVLCESTAVELVEDEGTRNIIIGIMNEVKEVGERVGVRVLMPLEERLHQAKLIGNHKMSMLQDWERGRRMEIASLATVVMEIASKLRMQLPHLELVHSLLKHKEDIRMKNTRGK